MNHLEGMPMCRRFYDVRSLAVAPSLVIGWLLATSPIVNAEDAFDVVIRGGRIVDGTGTPWYLADVGIQRGRIAKIGRISADAGQRTIDAPAPRLAPGFIATLR